MRFGFLIIPMLLIQVYMASADGLNAEQKNELVADFCYAIQASGSCPELNMRLDTEGKVEDLVGGQFRASGTPHTDTCMEGISRAIEDQSKSLCQLAWQRYGCWGSKMPTLLYQRNDFCKFDSKIARLHTEIALYQKAGQK